MLKKAIKGNFCKIISYKCSQVYCVQIFTAMFYSATQVNTKNANTKASEPTFAAENEGSKYGKNSEQKKFFLPICKPR